MKNIWLLIPVLILSILYSCSRELKFDKEKWNKKNDLGYPEYRVRMLDNLLSIYDFQGSSLGELHEMLDTNYMTIRSNKIYINIETSHGFDIDPVYTKDFILILDTFSIVSHAEFRVSEKGKVDVFKQL